MAVVAVGVESHPPLSHRSRRSGTRNVYSVQSLLCTSSSRICSEEACSSKDPSSRNWATRGIARSDGRQTFGMSRTSSVASRREGSLDCKRLTILILATMAMVAATSVAADTAQRVADAAKAEPVVALAALADWLETEAALQAAMAASTPCRVRRTRKRLGRPIACATKRSECLV